MTEEIILRLENITKLFPGVKALDNVHLEIKKGEVHALIGENGAGKSTLMNTILGVYKPDSGKIIYKGKEVCFKEPSDALSNGISMMHQEITLSQNLSVAENIWLGREKRFKKFGLLDVKARVEATEELLEKLEIHLDANAIVKNLSVANMQLVEIARAISYNADLIIMDEPTSSLTNVEIKMLYKIIKDLSESGVSIIFISHKLDEIFTVCDRVTVFRDGQYIVTKNCDEIDEAGLITYIVGRKLENMYPKEKVKIGETVLEVSHLSQQGVFEDVSFKVHAGEILGFSGLVGAGRTEVMRAIFGIDPYDAGTIKINGKEVSIKSTKSAIESGIGMVNEDRLRMGAIYTMSIVGNMTLACLQKIANRIGLYSPRKEMEAFNAETGRVAVKYSSPYDKINQLSGGNQQKIIISRWLMTHPKILILDEPTRGIDVGSKSEIYALISKLAGQGMAIIMVSSELPEVLGMSDRICVMRGGKIVYECLQEEATQELLVSHAFGAV